MYESEVNDRTESPRTVPEAVIAQLVSYREQVRARSVLPWGEHCTECVWPSCYTSCELYEPRLDGGCRQFVAGVIRVPTPEATVPYLQKITFRRWAKLWTTATAECQPLETADRWERLNIVVGSTARNVPAPSEIKHRLLSKLSYVRRRKLVPETNRVDLKPHFFVIEIYNPTRKTAALTLTVRANAGIAKISYQKLIHAAPEFTRAKIPYEELGRIADESDGFQIEIVPNEAENLTLYFGLIDFVREKDSSRAAAAGTQRDVRKYKCVVWDLDNTLWNGILLEDGQEGIRLREGVKDVIAELDRRGILQSVASKNNEDDAWAALKRFGIDEYFLYPQIRWSAKSQSLAAIAKALNIDVDAFVFVDDQEFERQEVATALPTVRVVDATDLTSLIEWPSLQVPITEESANRRIMYRQQQVRDELQIDFQGDYLSFLKANSMQMSISSLTDANIQRVYELAQRTNQMNFSGNRYSLEQLKQIEQDRSLRSYVLRCGDRFGSYGIVGFAVVKCDEPRLLDLMFSCRVQAKRVEHGFLAWLIRQHRETGRRDFFANFRKTPKNDASGTVFQELGFDELGVNDGVTSLRFGKVEVPDEGVLEIGLEGIES